MHKGKVWLVGAGPGDVGLLTIKGREVLENADVIIYDALVSTEIISTLPTATEKINVGKRARNHIASQSEINQILVDQAMEGKKVVRLKGGDPFVFGRGGEELELLVKEQIPFEIVPGITSAVAVPAYAGIPVTHRDYTSSFHIITGHGASNNTKQIDFQSLAHMHATLVFLMGIGNLQAICEGLMGAGMDPATPASVLERGTNASQRKVISSLAELCQAVEKANIGTPAIIVVGDVCKLSNQFSWMEKRTLGGKQLVVTRPQKRNSVLAQRLRTLGAQVIEMPGIETQELAAEPALLALKEIATSDYEEEWIICTSPAGVNSLWNMMGQNRYDLRELLATGKKVRFAAIGTGTAREFESRGIFPDVVPDVYCAQKLGEAIASHGVKHGRATIFRAKAGSELLIPPMERAGITCRDIPVYETSYVNNPVVTEQVEELLNRGEIHGITFTSASTVKSFTHSMGEQMDYGMVQAICIGEQTAAEAAKYGMQIHISREASIDSMVDCIVEIMGR